MVREKGHHSPQSSHLPECFSYVRNRWKEISDAKMQRSFESGSVWMDRYDLALPVVELFGVYLQMAEAGTKKQ